MVLDSLLKKLTIENTARPTKQAVALAVSADRVASISATSLDTKTHSVHKGNQFYKNCIVEGTMNFIFGKGSAVFQECLVLVKKPLLNQKHILTVDGRNEDPKFLGNGISIQKSLLEQQLITLGRKNPVILYSWTNFWKCESNSHHSMLYWTFDSSQRMVRLE